MYLKTEKYDPVFKKMLKLVQNTNEYIYILNMRNKSKQGI